VDAVFQEDNVPIHTAGTGELQLPWSAQSPDLNIIESLNHSGEFWKLE
jgi:hypothetical protein